MKELLITLLLLTCQVLWSKHITGSVCRQSDGQPIEYVNIGIAGKNIGTVADANGRFSLTIDPTSDNDTLLFSVIGYQSRSIKITDLKEGLSNPIKLSDKIYTLQEIAVRPKKYKDRKVGIRAQYKRIAAGFHENKLGKEMGVMMQVKHPGLLKEIHLNIAGCSYDTVFYRINVYRAKKRIFENILSRPVYIHLPKEKCREEVVFNLEAYNIMVEGKFLVTLEQVKDLGSGHLHFCATLGKTYHRATSQGRWETAPIAVSIGAIVEERMEK